MSTGNLYERLKLAYEHTQRHETENETSSETTLNMIEISNEIGRLIFVDSVHLLDDILNDPLSIDYFNIFLSLPIFGQRLLRHRFVNHFEYDPSIISSPVDGTIKKWLTHCRLANYIQTDIYIENLLAICLNQWKPSSMSIYYDKNETHPFIPFHTAASIQEFYQFLQSTSGLNYWNFSIDTLRFLRSRYLSQSTRIDNSRLNYLYKYSIRADEFRSIMINNEGSFFISDPNATDAIFLQMIIKAIDQLRDYWLPRYLSERSSHAISSMKQTTDKNFRQEEVLSNEIRSETVSIDNPNPNHDASIQSDQDHPYRDSFNDDHNEISPPQEKLEIVLDKIEPELELTLEDFLNKGKLEYFYSVIGSDALAGWSFADHLRQTQAEDHLEQYLYFMRDVEILLSMESGPFKQRILRHLIAKYLQISSSQPLPMHLFDDDEQQRSFLINDLSSVNQLFPSTLRTLLLRMIQILLPHFIRYNQYDRLRFFIQGQSIHRSLLNNEDLREYFPSIDFDQYLRDAQSKAETTKPCPSKDNDLSRQMNCLQERIDFITTEKSINTDERCPYFIQKRFLPLNDKEINEELQKLSEEFHWNEIKNSSDPSLNVTSIVDRRSSIENPSSPPTSNSFHHRDDNPLVLEQIDAFTSDILQTGLELFAVDQFVSDIIQTSLDLFDTDEDSTPISALFDEILQSDSSSIHTTKNNPYHSTLNYNQNAFFTLKTRSNQQLMSDKIFSPLGSYFINNPNSTSMFNPMIYSYLKENQSKSIEEFSFDSDHHGQIKELIIDQLGIGYLSIDLKETTLKADELERFERITLYTSDHTEFLFAKIKSYSIDSTLNEILYLILNDFQLSVHSSIEQTIRVPPITNDLRYAPKDQSIGTHEIIRHSSDFYLHPSDEQELMNFIDYHVNSHQWPLKEFIGQHQDRCWRAFELAKVMSNMEFSSINDNYDRMHWIAIDDNLGSFSEGNVVGHVQRSDTEHYIISSESNYDRGLLLYSCIDDYASFLID